MNSCEFTFLLSSLACCIADGKSAEEVNFIGSALAQLGDTPVAIGARESLCSTEHTRSLP